jgi:GSH-dependent disulfide-bond oxidoreductase
MIKLYGITSPNVLKVALMLEEIGAEYSLHYVPIFTGGQFDPAFEEISPNHKVPVIVDEDAEGGKALPIFESGAILIYLADKMGWGLSQSTAARSTELQWLMLQMSSIGPMIGQYVHFQRYAPAGSEYALARYESQVRDLFDVLERRLNKVQYLGGDAYSIADISVLPCVRGATMFFPWYLPDGEAALARSHPALARWYRELVARPAFHRAVSALDAFGQKDAAAVAASTEDDWDKFFKRGKYGTTGNTSVVR